MDSSIGNLLKYSQPRVYNKGDYICNEGEPGNEMYIVAQGKVGVYISSMLDEVSKVGEITAGGFFGEMSMFDHLPRSATCIAEDNTVCVAVDSKNLQQFIAACPDIAETLVTTLSLRLRDMNNMLFKTVSPDTQLNFIAFELTEGTRSTDLREPGSSLKYTAPFRARCPICGRVIVVQSVRANELGRARVLPNQRRVYDDFDRLWHSVWSCPECGYSNYYLSFFTAPERTRSEVARVITDEETYLKRRPDLCTRFDSLIVSYHRALHFNRCLDSENTLVIGKLWLYLSWLYGDAGLLEAQAHCRVQALINYLTTYTRNHSLLSTEGAKQQCAMIIAVLYLENGEAEAAKSFFYEVVKYSGQTLANDAYDYIHELRNGEES